MTNCCPIPSRLFFEFQESSVQKRLSAVPRVNWLAIWKRNESVEPLVYEDLWNKARLIPLGLTSRNPVPKREGEAQLLEGNKTSNEHGHHQISRELEKGGRRESPSSKSCSSTQLPELRWSVHCPSTPFTTQRTMRKAGSSCPTLCPSSFLLQPVGLAGRIERRQTMGRDGLTFPQQLQHSKMAATGSLCSGGIALKVTTKE